MFAFRKCTWLFFYIKIKVHAKQSCDFTFLHWHSFHSVHVHKLHQLESSFAMKSLASRIAALAGLQWGQHINIMTSMVYLFYFGKSFQAFSKHQRWPKTSLPKSFCGSVCRTGWVCIWQPSLGNPSTHRKSNNINNQKKRKTGAAVTKHGPNLKTSRSARDKWEGHRSCFLPHEQPRGSFSGSSKRWSRRPANPHSVSSSINCHVWAGAETGEEGTWGAVLRGWRATVGRAVSS